MKNTIRKNYFTIKIDLKMKITALFLLVVLLQLNANNSYSQKAIVSIKMENATLESVFLEIEKNTDYNILYKNSILDISKKITIDVDKMKIDQLMDLILKETNVSFEIRRKLIVLIEKNEAPVIENKSASIDKVKIEDQTIIISGVITDQSGMPLPGVSILLKGSGTGVSTDFDGKYTIDVSKGDILEFSFIGFETTNITVGDSSTINVILKAQLMNLDEVIVTATGARKRVEMGNSIAKLDVSDDVKDRPISNVFDVLQGQAAGVQIGSSGGAVGMGSRIRIRGSNSASLSNEPVIYLDGVLINNQANSISFETGGQAPSRLDDINPEDIETIEIIKGPSAATLYGSIAANGVIVITTKRGTRGDARWNAFAEMGQVKDIVTYPKNYQAYDAAGNPGFNYEAAEGTFVPDRVDSFQPLNDPRTRPFRTGQSVAAGISVSGGSEGLTYYMSGNYSDQEGVLPISSIKRYNFRGNFGAKITEKLNINLTTGYTNSDLALPLNDNFALGLMGQGLNGFPTIDINNGWGEFTPAELFTIDTRQAINRFTTGLEAIWKPTEKINVRIFGGLDYTNRWDTQFFPTGEAPAFLNYDEGARFSNRFNDFV